MKRNHVIIITATIILASLISACTRSASGGASDLPAGDELPNPVSTQSELMKEIIAGTQTAMAKPITEKEAEEAPEGEEVEAGETPETEATPKPKATQTPQPLPTSTQGPAPVVELEYNASLCGTSDCVIINNQTVCCCITDVEKDKKITVQVSNPFFPRNSNIEIKMGRSDEYDFSKLIVAGTAKYEPSGKGNFFKTTVNIPDSLRGLDSIYVRVTTIDPGIFAQNVFTNK